MNEQKTIRIGFVVFALLAIALGLSAQDYSLNLNGNGQYANCGNSPDFNFSNAFTVEAWIYPTDFKAEEHMNTIVAKTLWSYEFSHGWSFRYGSANRTLNLNMGGGAGVSWIDCRAEGVLTLNTWQHVAATYDGATIRTYVNGALVASQNCPGNVVNADNDLCIGTINHADMRCMTGNIDEVRIWNVVRSETEISASLGECEITENLLAYYRMTNGSGTALTDNSNHGHPASLIGSPTWDNTNQFYVNPIVKTEDTTSIEVYNATANGNILLYGTSSINQHGHCWNTDPVILPTINDSRSMLGAASSTGAFSSYLASLVPITEYRVRSYVTDNLGNTTYGQPKVFNTGDTPLPSPNVQAASLVNSSGFTANWSGSGWDSTALDGYGEYDYEIDLSIHSDFSSFVEGYHNLACGTHDYSSNTTNHSFELSGLAADTIYYYRIRSKAAGDYSDYSATMQVTTLTMEYSLQLNGNNKYVMCGNQGSFSFSGQLTVEAWIYPTDFKETSYSNTIVAKTNWGYESYYGWSFCYGSSLRTLEFSMSGGGAVWIDCRSDYALTINTWQHVAASYDGSNIRLYVNGALVATQAYCGGMITSLNSLCIGSTNQSDMRYMTGKIDEVRIWNRARSENEISTSLCQCEINDDLLAYYRMSIEMGTSLSDSSNHYVTGSLYGSPTWDCTNLFNANPIVKTEAPTSIGVNSATANGNILLYGTHTIIQHGHCWRTGSSLPTIDNSRTLLGPSYSTGTFSSSMTALLPYYEHTVRAYVSYMVGSEIRTAYSQAVSFSTLNNPPPTPSAESASSITNSSFHVNWSCGGWYTYAFYGYLPYSFYLDVSTESDFEWCLNGYNHINCGYHTNSATIEHYSYDVTGLAPGTTYYYRLQVSNGPYSATIPVTTLAETYNVYYDTGSITGVWIQSSDTDYGIDPESPLLLTEGFSGSIIAWKDGYTWSLAEGSDSNHIDYLSSDLSISFVGTYLVIDPVNAGFVYQGEPDVPISIVPILLEDITVPLPPLDPGEAIALRITGTTVSDVTITVPSGTWYAVAYYDDPAAGGLAWHHANPYPVIGPRRSIVFFDLPLGSKSEILVLLSSQDVTLPVELSSFTALAMGYDRVNLNWITHSESNLLGFIVLKNTTNLLGTASIISELIPATNSSQTAAYYFRDEDLAPQTSYFYWLETLELNGNNSFCGPQIVTMGNPNDPEIQDIPLETCLLPSYPNPFNPSTTIHYQLKSPERVNFTIYNCKGQVVATHSQVHTNPGDYTWIFGAVDRNGKPLASGLYLCVMTAGDYSFTNRIMLLK